VTGEGISNVRDQEEGIRGGLSCSEQVVVVESRGHGWLLWNSEDHSISIGPKVGGQLNIDID
jgi:hypothetical protein